MDLQGASIVKTKDELTKLAFKISALVDEMKSQEAAALLDALHSEGMTDAENLCHATASVCRFNIRAAINAKPKITY